MGWQRRTNRVAERHPLANVDIRDGRRRSVRRIVLIVALLMLAFISRGMYWYLQSTEKKPNTETLQIPPNPQGQTSTNNTVPKKKLTRLIATGDSIAHDAINAAAKQPDGSYNYDSMTILMRPLLQTAGIRFCNQSTQIGGEALGVSGYPDFNAPFSFGDNLVNVGCNLVNTASNHSNDRGKAAIDANTTYWSGQKMLASAGQYTSQADHDTVRFFEQDGLKYAFLAYTSYSNHSPPTEFSVGVYSRELAAQQIASAKTSGAKFIIVSMRWGTEYSQGVNAYQESESQYLADQGAHLILGHGPHVLEPVKRIKGTGGNDTLVWFSLGNFLHAQLEPETLFNGVAVIEIDPVTGTIAKASFLPTYMHYDWTADQAAKQDLLARRNFSLMPTENAAEYFSKSHLKTTITQQNERITNALNKFTEVSLITVKDLLQP